MVDVVVASDNVVVVGGPSAIDVALDIGPEGQRGSQIYTDLGKPTDPYVYLPDVQVNDLYINLKQSDSEYLYLYKYSSFNGVLGWTKVLRLVPNTVLQNSVIRFINGEAHTVATVGGNTIVVKGLYFPLSSLFSDGILAISVNDLNVQYSMMSDTDVSSGLRLDTVNTSFDVELFNGVGYDTQTVDFGGLYIRAYMYAKENATDINGFRTVNFLVTVGGRDVNANYIDSSSIEGNVIPMPSHGMDDGAKVIYLNNGNSDLSGLSNESEYLAILVDSDNISLAETSSPSTAITLTATAESETHLILKLMEIG